MVHTYKKLHKIKMVREYTNKLIDKIDAGYFTPEQILNEMLCFFSEEQIKDFCLSSFGNEGIFEEDEEE